MNESLTMLANKESANAGRKVYLSVINEEKKTKGNTGTTPYGVAKG